MDGQMEDGDVYLWLVYMPPPALMPPISFPTHTHTYIPAINPQETLTPHTHTDATQAC